MLRINPVDKSIGDILVRRRIALGESQESLAAKIGVIPEQLEKWEAGYARIPPASLRKIAQTLKARPQLFFSTSPDVDDAPPPRADANENTEAMQLVRIFLAFKSVETSDVRERIVRLVEELAKISRRAVAVEIADPTDGKLDIAEPRL